MGRYLIATLAAGSNHVVQIFEIAAGLNVADLVTGYEIVGSTGYRATLPACTVDICNPALTATPRINCTRKLGQGGQHAGQSVKAYCEELKTHCHGWHLPRVRLFAETVASTYGSAKRRTWRASL